MMSGNLHYKRLRAACRRFTPRLGAGFTLIEVMIVVVIVGILASIALPSYQNYIRKGKRAAAQSVLMEMASRQQAYLIDQRGYAESRDELWPGFAAPAEIASDFQFTVSGNNTGSPPGFSVSATPLSPQMRADRCGMSATVPMTLTHTGSRTPAACW